MKMWVWWKGNNKKKEEGGRGSEQLSHSYPEIPTAYPLCLPSRPIFPFQPFNSTFLFLLFIFNHY